MYGNYHWQKQQANEQIQTRLLEAEVHRSLKGNKKAGNRFSSLFNYPKLQRNKGAFVLTALLILLGLFLSACNRQEFDQKSDTLNAPPIYAELGNSWIRTADDMTMSYVPEGSFPMGNKRVGDEGPVHEVSGAAFWIDSTEVTNQKYAFCVNDGNCAQPEVYADFSDSSSDHDPVIGISWLDAEAYCKWAEAELPTEAQWEYAARGSEGLVYPWGQKFSGKNANFCDTHCAHTFRDEREDDGFDLLSPVGNYPDGKSWVGALDMSGNVSEWVQDWYDQEYYANSSSHNPQGPDNGELKVFRGGSWSDRTVDLYATSRNATHPDNRLNNVGFRCAITLEN